MKEKKGFSLVELLAVIVVLAMLLAIVVPKVMVIIQDSRKGTLETKVKMIAAAAEKEKLEGKNFGGI